MTTLHFPRRALLALLLSFAAAGAGAQAQKDFVPQIGQEGKDVIWVPTPQGLVDKMLDMAKVAPNDYVIDLGSGDGRTVITAAKRGARALGIEYNPDMVELSRHNAEKAGVGDKAHFAKADIFDSDFSQATVITMYLLPQLNLKLRPKILDLKPGTRIVSHAFNMGDWTPDETASFEGRTAYMWIVPARIEGTWRMPQGELAFKQDLQMVEGTLTAGGSTVPLRNGRLRGDQLSFSAGGANYTGRVNGDTIEGTVAGSSAGGWSAARTSPKPASASSHY